MNSTNHGQSIENEDSDMCLEAAGFLNDLEKELEELDILVSQCFVLHSSREFLKARDILRQLEHRSQTIMIYLIPMGDVIQSHSNILERLTALEIVLQTNQCFHDIRINSQTIQSFSDQFTRIRWKLLKESGKLSVYTGQPDNDLNTCIKVVGIMDVPSLNVLAVINEIDLFPYIPMTGSTQMYSSKFQANKFQKSVYQRLHFPWPLKDRDILLQAQAFDSLHEDGSILVVGKSISSKGIENQTLYHKDFDKEFWDACSKGDKECERVELGCSGALISPINEDQCKVTLLLEIDLKLQFIPSFLVRLLANQLLCHGFRQVEHCAQRISGSHYEQRIQERSELYLDIQARIRSYVLSRSESDIFQ